MKKILDQKKIAIFGLLGLGDMIHFSPCLRCLREGFPNSEIVFVTIWGAVYDLFKNSSYFDDVVFFEFFKSDLLGKVRFVRSLRKRHFDISILPYPSYRREFNIFSAMVGATYRYSFNFHKGGFSEFSFLNNLLVEADPTIHNVENNVKLMRALGLDIESNAKYDIPVQHSTSFASNFQIDYNVSESNLKIGIHPGSDARTKDKRLSLSKFVEISDYLASKYNARIFLFLGPHEEDLKHEFLRLAKHHHNIIEKLGLDHVAQIISNCDIFISNDSGLMHVASAMGVPTIAIFGPTSHGSLHPWQVPYEIVRRELECSPCFSFTERHSLSKPLIECKIDDKFSCMKKIESQDVLKKIEKMITLLYPEKQST